MAFDKTKPMDDEYIAAGPAAIRENLRALKEDQIVDAGTVNGLSVGNASGNIPKANGTLCTNLNAQYLGGNPAGYFSPGTHTHSAATTSSNGMMANTDKAKLDSIAAGAQVNQNAFAGVLVSGTTIQADAATDTLELVAGSNIALAPDATNDRITIGVTGTVPAATNAASCTGNAATATTLQTARTIGMSGDATGTATSFNGSTNITIPVTLATSGVTAGTYSSVTVDAKGRVVGGSNPNTISANTTGNAATATSASTANACAGNAVTATKLQTPRTINGVVFDGTANINITAANGGTIATTEQVNVLAKSRMQFFTATGIFTVPVGVTSVYVTLSGAGGGGGGSGSGAYSGAGGACGEYRERYMVTGLVSGSSINVTVGIGGLGGSGTDINCNISSVGTSGGASSFGSYISVTGGGGATVSGGYSIRGVGVNSFLWGGGYYLSGGDYLIANAGGTAPGKMGAYSDGYSGMGGSPGAGLLGITLSGGNGGAGAIGSKGEDGPLYGSGGGGGGARMWATGKGGNGGAGAPGFVLVEW